MRYIYDGYTSDNVEIVLERIDLSCEFDVWLDGFDKNQLIDFFYEGWVLDDLWERFYNEVLENPEMVGVEVVDDDEEE